MPTLLGLELEYMIVDRDTLNVAPIADQLLTEQAGELTGEVEVGGFCWSNELVLHVLEFKTNGPVASLDGVAAGFQEQVRLANQRLATRNACLLPTAMHPWMDPHRDTRVWPHDNAEIYAAFDRIFGCKGHGWSNLQSMHLNLPFASDEEFGRLHAAIRLVLPILPALAASSPIMDARVTGRLDNRLDVYRTNCARIPSLTGLMIPEPVFTPAEYQSRILERLYKDLSPHDPDGILQDEWVNARGAIARFCRNTIEIRLIDVQEHPAADLAIAGLVVATVEALMDDALSDQRIQRAMGVEPLHRILMDCIADADRANIVDASYLKCFGLNRTGATAAEIWTHLAHHPAVQRSPWFRAFADASPALTPALPLARRILAGLPDTPTRADLLQRYRSLAHCLAEGKTLPSA